MLQEAGVMGPTAPVWRLSKSLESSLVSQDQNSPEQDVLPGLIPRLFTLTQAALRTARTRQTYSPSELPASKPHDSSQATTASGWGWALGTWLRR